MIGARPYRPPANYFKLSIRATRRRVAQGPYGRCFYRARWHFVGIWPAFGYRSPLDNTKNEIRILTVLSRDFARNLNRENQILCTLEHVSLDSSPKYNALSYTWGEKVDYNMIWVNDQALSISKNLYTALQRIQHQSLNYPLWVDALCINQRDEVEKSQQVQMMYRIYKSATWVMVWLGPAADESDHAMKSLRRVGEDYFSKTSMSIRSYAAQFVKTTPMENATFPMPATAILLERPWWRRVWVQQEVASANNLIFFCGKEAIHSYTLIAAVAIFDETKERIVTRNKRNKHENEMVRFAGRSRALKLVLTLPRKPHETKRKSLLDLLWDGYVVDQGNNFPLEASDPRDLVFGLLSLAADAEELGLQADYSKPCEQVYTEVAKALIRSGNHSMILSCSQHPRHLSKLASWVPDWSARILHTISSPDQDPGKPFSSDTMGPQPIPENYRPFSASRSSQFSAKVTQKEDGADVLSISGVIVGSVIGTSVAWERDASWPLIARVVPFIYDMATLLGVEAMNFISFLRSDSDILWKTAIADKERLSNDGYCRCRPSFFEPIRTRTIELCERMSEVGSEEYLELLIGRDENLGIHHYLVSLNTLAHERRPFSTEQGLLGQGPLHVQAGDLVVIFLGHSVPFLLRKRPDTGYTLVGEAYVHGIMDGEFLEDNPDVVEFDIY